MRSGLRYLSISLGLSVLLSAMSATAVSAQAHAFIYIVTTSAPEPSHERWSVRHDAGYGDHSADPLGFDGMEQGVTFQGRLGHGFTVRGQVALGLDGQSTSSSQEVEDLKDLRSASRGIGLPAGLGMRREWAIFYASRNGRTSPAVRPLDARGNGFTANKVSPAGRTRQGGLTSLAGRLCSASAFQRGPLARPDGPKAVSRHPHGVSAGKGDADDTTTTTTTDLASN